MNEERKEIYKEIEINFRDGGVIIIPEDSWDDYDYDGKFIVIKKKRAWVAMYNAKDVFSLVLRK